MRAVGSRRGRTRREDRGKPGVRTITWRLAFSLSPAARRAAQREFDRARMRAEAARADVEFFATSLDALTDAELDAFTTFVVASESKAIIQLAYAVYGRMPREQLAKYEPALRAAKVEALRLMAGG
jgi:hypothetical protein